MKKFLFIAFCFLLFIGNSPGQNLVQAEYYVDLDPGPGHGLSVAIPPGDTINQGFNLVLTGLETGFHYLYIRVKDETGQWSLSKRQLFYLIDPESALPRFESSVITAAEYFFDQDPGPGNGISIPLQAADSLKVQRVVLLEGLAQGLHQLYIRCRDLAGKWSLYLRKPFTVEQLPCLIPKPDFLYTNASAGVPVEFTSQSTQLTDTSQYAWDVNTDGILDDTNPQFTWIFPENGVYDVKLTVDNSGGCKASVIHQVVVGNMPSGNIVVNGNTEFCQGGNVTLTAPDGEQYQWSTGDTTKNLVVNSSGSYFVLVTSSDGINRLSDTVTVSVSIPSLSGVTLHPATNGQANGTANAWVEDANGNVSYTWSTGSNAAGIINLAPASYAVTISQGNCQSVHAFEIVNYTVQSGDIIEAEYFIDEDPGSGNGIPIPIQVQDTFVCSLSIPMTGLTEGIHYLSIRVRDNNQVWSLF